MVGFVALLKMQNNNSINNETGNSYKHLLLDSAFTHIGLFEGIGGFSLASRWMGWETKAWWYDRCFD